MNTKTNRKINRKTPPAWMNEARAEASAPVKLPHSDAEMIADIDAITNAEDVNEYTPPASVYLFTGRDLAFDKFTAQKGESYSEADVIREIDALSRLMV